MKFLYLNILITFVFLLTLSNLSAQSSFLPIHSYSLHTDQDAFAKSYNEDRNYTMGFALSASIGEHTDNSWLLVPAARKGIDYLLGIRGLRNSMTNTNVSKFSFLASGFTPEVIDNPMAQLGDRPYASLLIIGSDRVSIFNENVAEPQEIEDFRGYIDKRPFAISTSLYVGFLGLGVANKAQSHIHRNHWFGSTRPVPLGWDTQISNGGELTAMYQINFISSLVKINNPTRSEFKFMETTLDVGAQAGYYTNLNAGINIKMGNFDAPFYTSQGLLNAVAQAPDVVRPKVNWYIFSSFRSRLVLYNALMEGQFKENLYELQKSEIEPIVIEVELGIAVKFYDRVEIVYKPLVVRTKEFKSSGRDHIWANLSVTVIID